MTQRRRRPSRGQRGQADPGWTDLPTPYPAEPTELHRLRLDTVLSALMTRRPRRVADLGCGQGLLVARLLADPDVEAVIAVDESLPALSCAERRAAAYPSAQRLTSVHASFDRCQDALCGVDAVAMVETIEHIEPHRLAGVEHVVFGHCRPRTAVITTPNHDYNPVYGLPPGAFRDPGHCFEWSRARFRSWSTALALRRGYGIRIQAIGPVDPWYGSPTQMAVFYRL